MTSKAREKPFVFACQRCCLSEGVFKTLEGVFLGHKKFKLPCNPKNFIPLFKGVASGKKS